MPEASSGVPSAASDAVIAAEKPSPENRRAVCDVRLSSRNRSAFRHGTPWNSLACASKDSDRSTVTSNRNCAAASFAAVNLRGVPENEDERRWTEVSAMAADLFADMIADAKRHDEASGASAAVERP